jgi:hypothetical protein
MGVNYNKKDSLLRKDSRFTSGPQSAALDARAWARAVEWWSQRPAVREIMARMQLE